MRRTGILYCVLTAQPQNLAVVVETDKRALLDNLPAGAYPRPLREYVLGAKGASLLDRHQLQLGRAVAHGQPDRHHQR